MEQERFTAGEEQLMTGKHLMGIGYVPVNKYLKLQLITLASVCAYVCVHVWDGGSLLTPACLFRCLCM